MRPAKFALCIVALAACSDSTTIVPVTVQWMEWPAEVASGQPFRTRLIVSGICALNPRFRPGASADESAVTFTPYFLTEGNDQILCLARDVESLVVIGIDTAGMAPGLRADFPRTYEMRGAANVYATLTAGAEPLPLRTFGEVVVRLSAPDASRRNAAGHVYMMVDTLGCVRVQPIGAYQPSGGWALESQTDTAGVSGKFVRGYFHQPAVPVCGDTKVFHLESRN